MTIDIFEYAEKLHCQELHMFVDPPTGLRAIVVIHSTKLGPALGGCRWVHYANTNEAAVDAMRLAEGMTYKSSVAGLNLGGGKAVLLKPDNIEALDQTAYFQAFGRCLSTLNGRYITAVDVGTSSEDMDAIATTSPYVVSTSASAFSSPNPSPLTAFGVFNGIQAAVKYKLNKDQLTGVTIAVQGVGHVGYELVKLLYKAGANLVVTDANTAALNRCQQDFGNITVEMHPDKIYDTVCDVFAPCALGSIINSKTIARLKAGIVAGGANNQLQEPEADAKRLRDSGILYAPDFVINAGGIIYVAGQHYDHSEEETKQKIADIYNILLSMFQEAETTGATTYEIAYKVAKQRLYDTGSGS